MGKRRVGGASDAPVSTGLRAGDRIGRYRVERSIGRGGMGEVFVAVDEHLSRRVALKVLMADDEPARARFLREARAAAAVHHANIATVFDAGEDRGLPFLAMELVEGGNLRDRVLDRSFTTVKRLTCLLDVARGLAEAHRHELVHRDVKPENVMLARDGAAKVVDFGIARSAAQAPGSDRNAAQAAKLSTITRGEVLGADQRAHVARQILNEPLDPAGAISSRGASSRTSSSAAASLGRARRRRSSARSSRGTPPSRRTILRCPGRCRDHPPRAAAARADRFASMDELAAALYVALPAVAADAVPPLSSVPAEVMRDALQFGATAANISYDRVVDTGAQTMADTGGGGRRSTLQQTTASPGAPPRPRWIYAAFAGAVALVAAVGSGLVAHNLRAPHAGGTPASAPVDRRPPRSGCSTCRSRQARDTRPARSPRSIAASAASAPARARPAASRSSRRRRPTRRAARRGFAPRRRAAAVDRPTRCAPSTGRAASMKDRLTPRASATSSTSSRRSDASRATRPSRASASRAPPPTTPRTSRSRSRPCSPAASRARRDHRARSA